ncbi:MAG TPA: flagellar protein FlaG [Firmicutes bacterium]|jgi:flagellar protein FlaG|nr:flagellar protein FlaG [Bacillota bacterium]
MRVQGAMDLTKVSHMPQVPTSQTVERGSQTGRELSVDQLGKEGLQTEEVNKLDVENAVEVINKSMEYANRALRFSIHEDTQRIMVKVVDVQNDEVIKEIPPEEVLDTVARIREMIGLLVDKRA